MIAGIRGSILALNSDNVIIETSGIGFQVFTPSPTLDHLQVGEPIFLFTRLIVREDALSLYGFDTEEARKYFDLLMGVNGVGPKLALSILSTLTPDTIRRAVFTEQVELFSRVPGVGKKTAQKIMLHLQDRIPAEGTLVIVSKFSDVDTEVLSALTTLGYSIVEAQSAIQSIPRDTPAEVEARLRVALQYFSTP